MDGGKRVAGSQCQIVLRLAAIFLLFVVAMQPVTWGAEIEKADVSKDQNVYLVRMRAIVSVPPATMLSVLRDYEQYISLSPSIVESTLVRESSGEVRLHLVLRPCVLGFCKTLNKMTDIAWLSDTSVRYDGVPGVGDFARSRETISVDIEASDPGMAIFTYEAELLPNFFIPPVVGTWLISMQVQRELKTTLERVEMTYGEGSE